MLISSRRYLSSFEFEALRQDVQLSRHHEIYRLIAFSAPRATIFLRFVSRRCTALTAGRSISSDDFALMRHLIDGMAPLIFSGESPSVTRQCDATVRARRRRDYRVDLIRRKATICAAR